MLPEVASLSLTKQQSLFFRTHVRHRHLRRPGAWTAMVSTGTFSDAPLPCEKRRALFHSTLEPKHQRCSASLSQSQRSFAFVNSISTLLNKGGTHANVLMLLRTSVLPAKQAYVHSHSARTSVRRHERARVGGQGLKSKLRATRTSSRILLKHLECFSAHHAQLQASPVKLKARNTFKAKLQTCYVHACFC